MLELITKTLPSLNKVEKALYTIRLPKSRLVSQKPENYRETCY